MLKAHGRMTLARLGQLRNRSALLVGVLAAFIIGYLLVGFGLFHVGLGYLHNFPLVGALLSRRILFLAYAFIFVMLVFSNLIIGYSSLYRNRETEWLMTLPVPHRVVYRWKFFEVLVVSSWALLFLSAPMMVAYGRVLQAPPSFYVFVVLAYLPFVVIPAVLGSWGIVSLVRVLARPWVKRAMLIAGVAGVAWLAFAVKPVMSPDLLERGELLSFDDLLKHSRITLQPFLPSAWLAQVVLAWSEGLGWRGWFFFGVLLANALMGAWFACDVVARLFYGSFAEALGGRAARATRRARAVKDTGARVFRALVRGLAWGPSSMRAVAAKDLLLFWRDPAQWTQFTIFFGLLCIYVLNLRNISMTFRNPFWETLVGYLNLAACALTLSTLTTRFVFPQFSLEGRRLWVIGMAPAGLPRVLFQKLFLACVVTMGVTVSLIVASAMALRLPPDRVVVFAGAMTVMSATLSSMAVGLGALFPDLREDNPSKIVSGFGGTLCLVLSFMYIACFVALVAMPGLRQVGGVRVWLPDGMAYGLAAALSLTLAFVPMAMGVRRVNRLEI
jgi:ABC-2 type transport system permease protein